MTANWFRQLKFDEKSPIYLQIADFIKQAIAAGQLCDNDELPSRRALAAQLGINPMTVQKAYQQLESEGFLQTSPNAVSRVSANNLQQQLIREQLIDLEVKQFIGRAKKLDLDFKEIIDLISRHWD